jgi:hypothetical protein
MHTPYTVNFPASFAFAQWGAGVLLVAIVLFYRYGSTAARATMVGGIALAVVAYDLEPLTALVGVTATVDTLRLVLTLAATCGTVSAVLARKPRIAVVSVGAQVALWYVSRHVSESSLELCALHLAWLGVVVGLCARAGDDDSATAPDAQEASYRSHDWSAFALAVLVACMVCVFVMRRRDASADEWAYTYQAAAFAKGRVYGRAAPCGDAFRSFYVFEVAGHLFSQYTPGWPFFIAPLVRLGLVWLSGPLSFGLMVVGIARLARSVARGNGRTDAPAVPEIVRASGTWAAVLAGLGTMTLINAGSRYPHVFVAALYAWSLEALLQASSPATDPRLRWRWGLLLGGAAAMMLATRPADGALLGLGITVAFVASIVNRRLDLRTCAAAAGLFGLVSLLVLCILRLQLGVWFKTGYSLAATIYPWLTLTYSIPEPNEWKVALPLATGAYCWWPVSVPLGLAGLAFVRGHSQVVVAAFAVGFLAFIGYYESVNYGRGQDWGYGPRYLLPIIVPLSVGSALALAPLGIKDGPRELPHRFAFERSSPAALVVLSIVTAWMGIVPLVWPTVTSHLRSHAALADAIARAHLRNAIVLFRPGFTGVDWLDLTENLPLNLYPNQDVIIAAERSADTAECVQAAFPKRTLFRAIGAGDDIRFVGR